MQQLLDITGEELADKVSMAAAAQAGADIRELEYLLLPRERRHLPRAVMYLKEAGFSTSVLDDALLVKW